jgi:hypothetical protein
MDQQDYGRLKPSQGKQPAITVADLKNREPRSLMHGNTAEGNDFHVYLDEDGEFHVLTYKSARFPETLIPTQLKFMVVKYTHGVDGGVSSNHDFVPSKQAFAESCDFEFCEALKMRGIDVRFRGHIWDREQAGRWVAERFDSIQGAPAEEVCEQLFRGQNKLAFQSGKVTVGMVQEAVKALSVPYALSRQYYESLGVQKELDLAHIYVRKQDAASVKAKVLEFLAEYRPAMSDEALAEELVEQVFSFGEYDSLETMNQFGTEVRIRVAHGPGRMVLRDTAKLVHFRGPKLGHCEKAVTGICRGRPFIATFHKTVTNILFSQFGAKDGFVERYLQEYDLTPAGDMK